MSLGLPDFGSRGSGAGRGSWRLIQVAGYIAFAYALLIAATEGRASYSADRANEAAKREASNVAAEAANARRLLRKDADFMVATASVESSPERVLGDLHVVLPEGVSLASLRLDYTSDATTRVELGVVARGPEAYDRFLIALSRSPRFSEIRPGSESRPGLVRATVSMVHRPGGGVS